MSQVGVLPRAKNSEAGNDTTESLSPKSRNALKTENYQFSPSVTLPTVTQVLPSGGSFLTVSEVASRLGVARKTVIEWCRSGRIPAVPKAYGRKTTYSISLSAYEWFISQQIQAGPTQKPDKRLKPNHQDYQSDWYDVLINGLFNGKPYSITTAEGYKYYVALFFKHNKALTAKALEKSLSLISIQQFSTRERFYKALMCYAKYLISREVIPSGFIESVKHLSPKRHLPPKRKTVTIEGLYKLYGACQSLEDYLIVTLLSQTGLRASEACHLEWHDVDLDKAMLTVRLGKGNKTRRVGLTHAVRDVLSCWQSVYKGLASRKKILRGIDRNGLYQRLERIGRHAGIAVSPHALRRAFVTINANAGRPLQMLQRACGHSDIKTTMLYCQTSEQEVIDAMKSW